MPTHLNHKLHKVLNILKNDDVLINDIDHAFSLYIFEFCRVESCHELTLAPNLRRNGNCR